MPVLSIAAIVEGHGEVQAVPVLLRRLAAQFAPDLSIQVHPPIRRSRDKLLMENELDRDLALAAERVGRHGLVWL